MENQKQKFSYRAFILGQNNFSKNFLTHFIWVQRFHFFMWDLMLRDWAVFFWGIIGHIGVMGPQRGIV
jgi:hypothetical protein